MITTIWCTTLHLCNFMLFRRAQLGFYLLSFIRRCRVFLRRSNLHQTWARRPDIKLEKTKHDQHKFISRTSIKVHRRADNHIETFPVCCFCKNWFKHGGINIEIFLVCCFSRKKLIQAWWHYVSSRAVLLCNNFDKMALMSSLLSASLTNCIFAVILLPLFSAWNCVVWRRLIAPCQSCWTLMVNRKRPLWVLYICNLIPSIKSITGMITLSIWQIFWSSVWERERKDDLCGNLRCVEIRLAPTHWAGETFHWRLNRIKVESNEQFGESH